MFNSNSDVRRFWSRRASRGWCPHIQRGAHPLVVPTASRILPCGVSRETAGERKSPEMRGRCSSGAYPPFAIGECRALPAPVRAEVERSSAHTEVPERQRAPRPTALARRPRRPSRDRLPLQDLVTMELGGPSPIRHHGAPGMASRDRPQASTAPRLPSEFCVRGSSREVHGSDARGRRRRPEHGRRAEITASLARWCVDACSNCTRSAPDSILRSSTGRRPGSPSGSRPSHPSIDTAIGHRACGVRA